MKTCPACKRIEADDTLAFCRADGTALISDSGSVSAEIGTAKFSSAPRAIQFLEPALRYEAAADFEPQYFRGLSYLRLGKGAEAAVEFQKILDHKGQTDLLVSTLYPLAHLGLARALSLGGDAARARKAYEDFFALWRDADSDLPILTDAKNEYAKTK